VYFRKIQLIFVCLLLTANPLWADIDTIGSGTVAETITVDNYIYVRLMENNNWIAAAPTNISVGDKISYSGGALMKNFFSRTLNQNFEEILFVMELYVTEQASADPQIMIQSAHDAANTAILKPPKPGEITPADEGMTIAEIFSNHLELQNQTISVRARVMKVSPKIKGKNWITLQDGTGNAPDDKLIATSIELAEIGDEITVEGTLATNVSLGAGYEYKVLLENAQIKP